ncbi:MAG: ABC transporter ATP-binding protein [Lachnospiraceae bacterium]|nr:ABC transporter ATP-binding protein [Lachnospiraceae bacterium]
MSDYAIKVDHVSKIYKLYDKPSDRLKESLGLTRKKRSRDHRALNDVSFQVKTGETIGIIGTNGSGKSTILKIITGVLNPTEGNVEINGRISALLELGAGFNMEYTGIENVYLNGTMIGFSKEEIDAKLQDILDFADIGDFVNQPVKTYSSGMFVRLAFAVAINIDPEILIVDEALSVGDVFFQAKCFHKFEEFKKLGKTILFVSHDLGSISKYCDKVILLNKGNVLAEGEPKEIIDMYKKLLVNQLDLDEEGNVIQKSIEEAGEEDTELISKDEVWKDKLVLNSDIIEYGGGEAAIYDFGIFDNKGLLTNTIEKGTDFTIKMKIKFFSDVQEPIFAFTFKDIKGTEITGTNTMLEGVYFDVQHNGDEQVISFKQNMNLQGGEYLLSFGCTGYKDGEFTVYHRLYDVCNVSVIAEKNSVGYFDMFSKVKVE